MAATALPSEPPARRARLIRERWMVRATLTLRTPACLGNGERDETVDLPLHRDAQGAVLLSGDSLAGALRTCLRERERGYFAAPGGVPLTEALFGSEAGARGLQSALIVEDARCEYPRRERRDGVQLEEHQPTAEDKKKYDYELLAAGSTFDLEMELPVDGDTDAEALVAALVACLEALEHGAVRLGAKKSRGFGRCALGDLRVWRLAMDEPRALLRWLAWDHPGWLQGDEAGPSGKGRVAEAFRQAWPELAYRVPDERRWLSIQLSAALADGILIRSDAPSVSETGAGTAGWLAAPDAVHLKSWSAERDRWRGVLPGTALAGPWRARCRAILRTLAQEVADGEARAAAAIEAWFGSEARASRVAFEEHWLDGEEQVVASNRLDPLLQSSYSGALFFNQPLFPGEASVELRLKVPADTPDQAAQAVAGLLLLVLKDFWNRDLAVGGRGSVGYGFAQGRNARIAWRGLEKNGGSGDVTVTENAGTLTWEPGAGALNDLNEWVKAIAGQLLGPREVPR